MPKMRKVQKPPAEQQLTLFNMKPTAEHRWPRGYTPERQAEVREALDPTEVRVNYHTAVEGSPFVPSRSFFTPFKPGDPGYDPARAGNRGKWSRPLEEIHQAQSGQAKRALTDMVARSTVPVADIQAPPTFHVESLVSAGGLYHRPGLETERHDMGRMVPDPESEAQGRISLAPGASQHTVIHELGHHVDAAADPELFRDRSSLSDLRSRSGLRVSPALEGFAEGYAFKHITPRRGEKLDYPKEAAYKELHPQPAFRERFTEAAGVSPEEAMARPEPPVSQPQMGHQMHLFSRDADYTESRIQADYGQFDLTADWDKEPGEWRGKPLEKDVIGGGVPKDVHFPGFEPGDEEHFQAIKSHRAYDVPKETRKRLVGSWNKRYPDEPMRGY